VGPTDDEIKKQEIIDQLIWDDSVDANDVFVSVRSGIAELTGSVPTYATRLAAERDAWLIDGIFKVDNKLDIQIPDEAELPTDDEITANVENKLLWDSQINAAGIRVETTHNIVTLTGVVDSYWEKSRAEDIAYYTHGVIDVVNNLAVTLSKSVIDIDIENDIRKAFKRNSIDDKKINVSVKNGVVNLSGIVRNHSAKRQAYNIAMYTTGVVNVVDDIVIA
jgi:osmotically-inducible protein OsmY